MRTSLDHARLSKARLEKARPLLKFIGFNTREPWEMLSLRERLKTVEEALRMLSRELAQSTLINQGLKRELKQL